MKGIEEGLGGLLLLRLCQSGKRPFSSTLQYKKNNDHQMMSSKKITLGGIFSLSPLPLTTRQLRWMIVKKLAIQAANRRAYQC